MNKLKIMLILVLSALVLVSCADNTPKNDANPQANDSVKGKQSEVSDKKPSEKNAEQGDAIAEKNTADAGDIAQKTKDYILNGQGDKPEAEKLKWRESFLNAVDMKDAYEKYLASGGKTDDVQGFAQYLTLNAPVPENWEALTTKDLMSTYGEKVSKITHLEDNLYQIYVIKDGSEVPYVVVNSRTGYFHG